MGKMVYEWKDGAHIRIDAQKAGEEMERIRVRNNGRLETSDVVTAARSPRSAMHGHFEWDDATAADAYRNDQAGHLIRCITVTVGKPGEEKPTRAFVSVRPGIACHRKARGAASPPPLIPREYRQNYTRWSAPVLQGVCNVTATYLHVANVLPVMPLLAGGWLQAAPASAAPPFADRTQPAS